METLPFTPAFDDPATKLKLKLEGEIERLVQIIRRAKTALEDGRRGDALKLLRESGPLPESASFAPPTPGVA